MATPQRPACRLLVASMLLVLACSASAYMPGAGNHRMLLGQKPHQHQHHDPPQPPQQPAGDQPQTCCRCTCVVPSKQPNLENGTAGLIGPTYGKAKFCRDGFWSTCDDVCLDNMGTFTTYKPCV